MNTETLLYFKLLAECEHYPQAAELLDIAQSTLSYSIKKMEEELEVPLFMRRGRNITLSRYGKAFYRCACQMLSEFESGKAELRKIKNEDHPSVSVGFARHVSSVSFLPQLIYDFIEAQDGAGISVNAAPYVHSAQLLSDIRSQKIDFGICMKTESFNGLTATKVLRRSLFALVPGNHPLVDRDTVQLDALVESTIILEQESPSPESPLNEQLINYCKNINPHFTAQFANDRFNVMALAAKGCGIGITSDPSLADVFNLKSIAVEEIPWKALQLDIDFYFVHLPVLSSDSAKTAFIKFVEQHYTVDYSDKIME